MIGGGGVSKMSAAAAWRRQRTALTCTRFFVVRHVRKARLDTRRARHVSLDSLDKVECVESSQVEFGHIQTNRERERELYSQKSRQNQKGKRPSMLVPMIVTI